MTTSATAVQPEYVTLPLDRIRESTTNPRQRFNDLEELAASIRTHGILQPILVRPLRKDFELVVGARRLRAAQLAGLTSVPAQVKALDDRSAREVQIIENLQRQDVHPLEEADGYKSLLDSPPSCTIDEIAAKVGKSKAYVYQRLSLTRLAAQVREVVAADALPLSYALKLASLDAATQLEALERCFRPLGGDAKYSREWLEPIARLQEWLGEHARLDPRSEQAKVLLPELAAQVEEVEQAQAATVLAVSTLHFHTDRREPKPILARSWKLAEGKHKCQYSRPAVIELGEQQGRFIHVCIEKKKCTKHWPQQRTGTTSNAQRAADERRRTEEERRRLEQERRRALFEQHVRPNTLNLETPGGRILVEVANKPAARAAGLSNRDALNGVDGLLLKWETPARHPIWMAEMRFSLDLVWIDAAGRITAVLPNLPPCRLEPCPLYEPAGSERSLAVLELSAGEAAHHGLTVSAIVQIQNLSHGQ